MYGVTLTGFNKKTQSIAIEEMRTDARSLFGASIDVEDESPLGNIINIVGFQAGQAWDGQEGVYNSQYQNLAEGVPLDNAMALTNNTRLDDLKSSVSQTILGLSGTIIPQGFRVSVVGDSTIIFETTAEETIPISGTIDLTMLATEFGAKIALAGTLTIIDTPINGITSTTNSADAIVGRDSETDAEFKLSAENQKQKSGTSPVEGIRGAILDLDNVIQAVVIENVDIVVDIDGRPPKSVEAVVQGGDDTEIAQAIFDSKSAGIETFGSESEIITDNQGLDHTINFNRPTDKRVYVIVNITPNTDPNEGVLYPVDGDDQIKDAIVAWGLKFLIGQDVLRDGAKGIINPINEVVGIRVVEALFALTPTPTTDTPIAIGKNELASFAIGDIIVNS